MVGSALLTALRAVEKGPLEEDLDSWRGILFSDSSLKVFSGILAARLWPVGRVEHRGPGTRSAWQDAADRARRCVGTRLFGHLTECAAS